MTSQTFGFSRADINIIVVQLIQTLSLSSLFPCCRTATIIGVSISVVTARKHLATVLAWVHFQLEVYSSVMLLKVAAGSRTREQLSTNLTCHTPDGVVPSFSWGKMIIWDGKVVRGHFLQRTSLPEGISRKRTTAEGEGYQGAGGRIPKNKCKSPQNAWF